MGDRYVLFGTHLPGTRIYRTIVVDPHPITTVPAEVQSVYIWASGLYGCSATFLRDRSEHFKLDDGKSYYIMPSSILPGSPNHSNQISSSTIDSVHGMFVMSTLNRYLGRGRRV
jgi:hypothetical protein